ncbi:MAG: D-alanyl-D-alanine carboxypeptidase [Oscillospiraceae bacterium]|nr:D-alanyl-D-alanine carboxypeptidase [Oscillospiraceae bacterium]
MMGKSRLLKRLLGITLAAVMLVTLALPAFAKPAPLSEYAVVIDATTGQVLFDQNKDESISPSGLVKIMTALVAVESGTPISNKITVTSAALDPLGTGIRSMSLVAGEQLTIEACLQGMILDSANDAANVIAEVIGGDIATFVKNMNDKVAALGLEDTEFVNAHGLPENGQTTTAYDMAMILRAALTNPEFAAIFGTQEATVLATNYTTTPRNFMTRCRMNRNDSQQAFDGSLGGVIGYSTDTGYIIATAAVRDGRTLITVVAKSENEDTLYADATALLEYGLDGFTEHSFAGSEFSSGEIPLTEAGVKVGTVVFSVANEEIKVLLPEDADAGSVEAVAEALPSAVDKNSSMEYYANICYRHSDGTSELLIPDLLLTADIRLDSAQTEATDTPENMGTIATDDEGNPVTDDEGNVVTGTAASTGDDEAKEKSGGFKKFILTFLKIILIIIAVVAGLFLLLILSLIIIKQVKRAKKRKARARAAAERAARARERQQQQQNNNDISFF